MQDTLPPRWDLSDLFDGLDDPSIEQTFADQAAAANTFASAYRGKINQATINPPFLAKAISDYEHLLQELAKPSMYAQLRFSVETTNAAVGALLQNVRTRTVEIQQTLLFFELEIAAVSEIILNTLIQSPELAHYKHFLERQRDAKPHRLSESEESILTDMSLTASGAWTRFFEQELGRKMFDVTIRNEQKTLNESETLHLLHDADRDTRRSAAESLTRGLTQELPRITFIYNTLILDKRLDDTRRRFQTSEASRHLENEIDGTVVDALVAAVTGRMNTVRQFYAWKQKRLGLTELFDYDRYAPLKPPRATFSFNASRDLVLNAFEKFSPTFKTLAQTFFDKHWIDGPPSAGKRGGAFCSYATPDLHPYVFLNHAGSARDVLTMAHELGHAIHASLARPHGYLQFSSPLTLAETASIFAEMIVFHDLLDHLDDPEDRIALTAQKIEELFASVHRQIAMFGFERDAHAAYRKQGELTSETVNGFWRAHQTQMFGSSMTLTPGYDIWWSYVSHFFEYPFYVYAYAFGELLTLSLFARYQKQKTSFVDDYVALLSAGGSASPQALLAPFGIRLDDPTFWEQGLNLIDALVKQVTTP